MKIRRSPLIGAFLFLKQKYSFYVTLTMKILQSSASSQTLKIIPRSYPELVDVVIKNEDTKDVVTLSDVATVSNLGYLEIPSVFDLDEDTFYSFEVQDSDDSSVIYKGKIFCTNQENYSINNGEYTTRSRNNKYIVYGQ